MRNVWNQAAGAIAMAVIIGGALLFTTQTGESQGNAGAAGQVRRTADGKPDFSGVWQANSLAYWDLLSHDARPIVAQTGAYPDVPVLAAPVVALGTIGWIPADLGVVDGDAIPYQPWAAARQKENFANWLDRDPEIKCYLPGVPRAMYMPYKFQIIQGPAKVMMAFEYRNADRTIHLDEVVPYPGDAFMGHSVGKWEGDTLVVNVSSFTPNTGCVRSATSHGAGRRVTERYPPPEREAIQYQATMGAGKVFRRPWTTGLPPSRRLEPTRPAVPSAAW